MVCFGCGHGTVRKFHVEDFDVEFANLCSASSAFGVLTGWAAPWHDNTNAWIERVAIQMHCAAFLFANVY